MLLCCYVVMLLCCYVVMLLCCYVVMLFIICYLLFIIYYLLFIIYYLFCRCSLRIISAREGSKQRVAYIPKRANRRTTRWIHLLPNLLQGREEEKENGIEGESRRGELMTQT